MNSTNFVQADLRFLLPVELNQQVAVLGYAPELITSLQDTGAKCTLVLTNKTETHASSLLTCDKVWVTGTALPFTAVSFHHLFIPQLTEGQSLWLPDEITRVVKPGGWLFLGVRNRLSPYQLKPKKSHRNSNLSLTSLKQLFPTTHWRINQCYGVHDDLQHPQYLIPLEIPSAVSYFYEQIFIPYSQAAARLQPLALLLSRMGGGYLIFKDFALIAQHI